MQSMYDLVGDKIQEIFDAQVVDIGVFDFDADVVRFPYAIERGVRFPDEPIPIIGIPAQAHRDAREPLRHRRRCDAVRRVRGAGRSSRASRPRPCCGRP